MSKYVCTKKFSTGGYPAPDIHAGTTWELIRTRDAKEHVIMRSTEKLYYQMIVPLWMIETHFEEVEDGNSN